MSKIVPDQGLNKDGDQGLGSLVDELKRESERLRQLAAVLKAREEALAEMQANYPYFKKALYALLREKFEPELPPITDSDLEALAVKEGAKPLEAFIDELVVA